MLHQLCLAELWNCTLAAYNQKLKGDQPVNELLGLLKVVSKEP